jgi:pyruvate kinase
MVGHTDEMAAQVDRSLLEMTLVKDGDLVVIAAGSPPGTAGSTNMLTAHKVGDLADAGIRGESGGIKEKLGPWPAKMNKNKAAPGAPLR